jgi:hypothetical protein
MSDVAGSIHTVSGTFEIHCRPVRAPAASTVSKLLKRRFSGGYASLTMTETARAPAVPQVPALAAVREVLGG